MNITPAVDRMRRLPCDFCGAGPGEPCRKPTGVVTSEHASRYYAAHEAGLLPIRT